MKLRLPRRRAVRVGLYLLSAVLLIVAIDMVLVQIGRRITIGYETTRITEPTMPGGPIDYLSALENHFSAGVTKENNAAPLLLEAFGRVALASNQPPDGITSRLGKAPLPEKGDYFLVREKFPDDPQTDPESAVGEIEYLLRVPWKRSKQPYSAAWLTANEKPLAKVIDASKRSRFFYPYNAGYRPDTMVEILLPYLQPARDSVHALVTRSMLRLDEGSIDGAAEDLAAVHRLAGLFSQGATAIDRLVAFHIDTVASRAEQEMAGCGKLDKTQLQGLLKRLDGLEPLNGLADAIDVSERYMFLDSMQYGASHGLTKLMGIIQPVNGRSPSGLMMYAPIQYDHAMKTGNVWYDRALAAVKKPTLTERSAEMRKVVAELNAFVGGQQTFSKMTFSSDWPVAAFIPAFDKIVKAETAVYAERTLARVAAALAAYKAEHDTYPASLSEIAPAYLKEVPVDPFTDRSLVYQVTKDGYLLYSVGANETDDSGSRADSNDKGDLSVRVGSEEKNAPTSVPKR